jgi:hypothetical protein
MKHRALRRRYGRSSGSLHERVAAALKWPLHEVQSFSMHALRDLVRVVDPSLAAEMSGSIASGSYITGTRRGRRRSR